MGLKSISPIKGPFYLSLETSCVWGLPGASASLGSELCCEMFKRAFKTKKCNSDLCTIWSVHPGVESCVVRT